MPFRQRMRFRPRFNAGGRNFRARQGSKFMRPIVHVTRNRFELTAGPTTAGTEFIFPIVDCVEAPTNRGIAVPAGCVLRNIVARFTATASTAGKHQALLVYRPAAENLVTPIAAYWDLTDPLTEEGVKMRRLAMSKCQTMNIESTGTSIEYRRPFTFRWKGAKRMYDGDSVDVFILDVDTATTYNAQIWLKFSQ